MPGPVESIAHPCPGRRLPWRHEAVRTGSRCTLGDALECVASTLCLPPDLAGGGLDDGVARLPPPSCVGAESAKLHPPDLTASEAAAVEAKHSRHGVRPSLAIVPGEPQPSRGMPQSCSNIIASRFAECRVMDRDTEQEVIPPRLGQADHGRLRRVQSAHRGHLCLGQARRFSWARPFLANRALGARL
jgi:hypothetical protein